MTSKNCTKCKKLKPLTEFSKQKSTKDGFQYICKSCDCAYKLQYNHSKDGLLAKIYGNQHNSSRRRKHVLPNYTLTELREWVFSQPMFETLYQNWQSLGYQTRMKPSCDRKDDYKPYTFENLQLMTWQQNNDKGHADIRNGINNKQLKPVVQMDLKGQFVAEHHSGRHAARITGIQRSDINRCCRGKAKTAGGFRWMRSIGIQIANNANFSQGGGEYVSSLTIDKQEGKL